MLPFPEGDLIAARLVASTPPLPPGEDGRERVEMLFDANRFSLASVLASRSCASKFFRSIFSLRESDAVMIDETKKGYDGDRLRYDRWDHVILAQG